jgi:hypothetical protein
MYHTIMRHIAEDSNLDVYSNFATTFRFLIAEAKFAVRFNRFNPKQAVNYLRHFSS